MNLIMIFELIQKSIYKSERVIHVNVTSPIIFTTKHDCRSKEKETKKEQMNQSIKSLIYKWKTKFGISTNPPNKQHSILRSRH